MRKILFCFAVLTVFLALTPTASAQQARRADLRSAQTPELSDFLASLAGKPLPAAVVPSNGPLPCYPNYCIDIKEECIADCAPCIGVWACYRYVCDGTCWCQC